MGADLSMEMERLIHAGAPADADWTSLLGFGPPKPPRKRHHPKPSQKRRRRKSVERDDQTEP